MYSLLGKFAKIYPIMIVMGVMIVVIAFIIGIINANNAAEYFALDKVTRETTRMDLMQDIQSTLIWMPTFKFLGLGMIMGGIIMALRVIMDNLRGLGYEALPRHHHDKIPNPPGFWPLMPMFMMLGMVIFIVALIVGIVTAGDASDLFANPAPVIDAGVTADGVNLIPTIQSIHQTEAWLVPFKFFGISTMFLSITLGLYTIVWILNRQTEVLDAVFAEEKARARVAGD
ncbi:MAG: hypothetical protein D6737_16080 [Chloroflexi bacterium]|nr:MAG: hypothetical protein D6737_16080 [Chloroflexota bacterium]